MFDRIDEIMSSMAESGNGDFISSLAAEIGRAKNDYLGSRKQLLSKMQENDGLKDQVAVKDSEIAMLKHDNKRLKMQNEEVLQLVDAMNAMLMFYGSKTTKK
jgi:hypothetical protein